MQSLVGIYRTADDLERAATELQILKARAAAVQRGRLAHVQSRLASVART